MVLVAWSGFLERCAHAAPSTLAPLFSEEQIIPFAHPWVPALSCPASSFRLDIPENLTHVIASWAALDTRAIGVRLVALTSNFS